MNTDTNKISSITTKPTPPKRSSSGTTSTNSPEQNLHDTLKTNCLKLPDRSSTLPYPATEDNIPNLKQFLQQQFATSAFNQGPTFPEMKTPPAYIHLKGDASPYACHTSIPVPHHWKEQAKASLDADIEQKHHHKIPMKLQQPDPVR